MGNRPLFISNRRSQHPRSWSIISLVGASCEICAVFSRHFLRRRRITRSAHASKSCSCLFPAVPASDSPPSSSAAYSLLPSAAPEKSHSLERPNTIHRTARRHTSTCDNTSTPTYLIPEQSLVFLAIWIYSWIINTRSCNHVRPNCLESGQPPCGRSSSCVYSYGLSRSFQLLVEE